jgi:ATP-dependent Clp protease ATP-binding subunit ClpB
MHDEQLFEQTKDSVLQLLKRSIRPEFLNRIDEVVMFQPLSKREIKDITKLQTSELSRILSEQGVQVEFTKYALELLAEMGYDPVYGARPLKRVIQKKILNELSKILLTGSLKKEMPIKVDSFEEGKFAFFN